MRIQSTAYKYIINIKLKYFILLWALGMLVVSVVGEVAFWPLIF